MEMMTNKKSKCMVLMAKSIEMTFVSTRFFFFVNKMMFNTRYTNKEKGKKKEKKEKKRKEEKRKLFTVESLIHIELI